MNRNNAMRWLGLLGFSVFLGGFSFIVWRIPVQILNPEVFEYYLVPANGHVFANLILSWFMIGGYKTSLIMIWDRNEAYFQSIAYRVQAITFVPFAPITKFNSSWFKLPSVDDLSNK